MFGLCLLRDFRVGPCAVTHTQWRAEKGPPGSSGLHGFTQSSRRDASGCLCNSRWGPGPVACGGELETGSQVSGSFTSTSCHLYDLYFGEYLEFGNLGSISSFAPSWLWPWTSQPSSLGLDWLICKSRELNQVIFNKALFTKTGSGPDVPLSAFLCCVSCGVQRACTPHLLSPTSA